MLIGYARVSTQDQNLDLQTEALKKAGCKKIFDDRMSGSRAERPGLAQAQDSLRNGDTLVVWKLDRLGRSVKQLVDLVGELQKQGVQFKSLTDSIDTGSSRVERRPSRGRECAVDMTLSRWARQCLLRKLLLRRQRGDESVHFAQDLGFIRLEHIMGRMRNQDYTGRGNLPPECFDL